MYKLLLFKSKGESNGTYEKLQGVGVGVDILYPIIDSKHFQEFLLNQIRYYSEIQDIILEKDVNNIKLQ